MGVYEVLESKRRPVCHDTRHFLSNLGTQEYEQMNSFFNVL